jgi:hypothetical protein
VRVRMNFDDSVRLQGRNRDHELFGGAGLDAHPRKDRMTAAFIGSGEVATHWHGDFEVVMDKRAR